MADFEAFQSDDVAIRLRAWGGDHAVDDWDIEDGVPCEMLREAAAEIERLRHLLNEVNALHGTDEYENWCRHCNQMWPCPTVRLLQSEEDGRG